MVKTLWNNGFCRSTLC